MRLLLLLIIVLLALAAWWPEQPPPPVEETIIGPQLVPLNKAKNLEQDYLEGIDQKKREIEDQAGGG
jgi:hypothetical protein